MFRNINHPFPVRIGKVDCLSCFVIVVVFVGLFLGCKNSFSSSTSEGTDSNYIFERVKAIDSDFVADAIGVNTHINYTNTIYFTHYDEIIKPRLAELGIRHIRDHFGDSFVNARFEDLADNHGVKLLLICNDGGTGLETTLQEVKRLNARSSGTTVVELIEPANERDNGWKLSDGSPDWERLCHYMEQYYSVFRSDQSTEGVPLLGPSFANTRNSAASFSSVCCNIHNRIDKGNTHIYSGLHPESEIAGGWGISLEQAISNYKMLSVDKPIIDSETGYKMSNGKVGHPAVSQRTAAKYVPRLVLNRVKHGFERVYFYQLINNQEDFGLLNNDGSPRLQFSALKNLITLLKDPGEPFKPATLSFSLNGDLNDIEYMVFQKRDGRFYLIIWQGVNGSSDGINNNDFKDINHPQRDIDLVFPVKVQSVKQYRPSFETMPDGNGITPMEIAANVSLLALQVPDHILVIEITK